MIQQSHFWEWNHCLEEILVLPCSLHHDSQLPTYENNLHICQWMNGQRCGILFSLLKEGNTAICNNMDEPGGHYAKWRKPNRERQILHDLTYMWILKQLNSYDNRIEWCQGLKIREKCRDVGQMVQSFSYAGRISSGGLITAWWI